MKHLPYDGGTFQDVSVSEDGRRLLSDRLTKLTASQLTALFTYARDLWGDDGDGASIVMAHEGLQLEV